MVSEVVVISPDQLQGLIERAVQEAVYQAISALQKKTPQEMTEAEAAEYLGIAAQTLRGWRFQKKGPKYHKHGHIVRYAKADLDAWLKQSEVQTIDSLEARLGKSGL